MAVAPAVYFDLDGTLVDTTYLHAYSWWRALDDAGETRPMAAIHPLIGMGSANLLRHLLGRDDDAVNEAHQRHFAALHPFVRPLPGATTLVQRVVEAGGMAVVVTSATPRDLEALLRPLGGRERFAAVVDGEHVEGAKPAPDPFLAALQRTGGDPARSLAVGDSVWDVRSAAAAGVACVGLQSGGIARADLAEAGAAAVYRDCADALAHWGGSPMAALLAST